MLMVNTPLIRIGYVVILLTGSQAQPLKIMTEALGNYSDSLEICINC